MENSRLQDLGQNQINFIEKENDNFEASDNLGRIFFTFLIWN